MRGWEADFPFVRQILNGKSRFMMDRPYIAADFEALYALEEACFPPPFRFDRRYMRKQVSSSEGATWVTEENGRLRGFAIVEWVEGVAYIQTIEVDPALRGQGIGARLLDRMEDSARAAGAVVIWLHVDAENAAAIRLYEASGYRRQGKEEKYYPQGRAALIYAKRLAVSSVRNEQGS